MDRLKKLNGIFPLFKPSGMTSADALEELKKCLQKLVGLKKPLNHKQLSKVIKVGHGGTLDPLATGVLVVGLGTGCKQLHSCLSGKKVYRFKARFGTHYDTYDCTGKLLVEEKAFDKVNVDSLKETMCQFTGEIMQKPPAFSAVHVNGKRAYDLARSGEKVELAAKPIKIDRFELISYQENGEWQAEVECGGGTYIRSLIVDVASDLDTVAHMTELTRTQQDEFTLSDCLHLEQLTELAEIEKSLK